MNINAQLDSLTTTDKLRTMEYLWDGLCRHADEIPSPAWHGDLLTQREKLVIEGQATFQDWDAAKLRIRNALK